MFFPSALHIGASPPPARGAFELVVWEKVAYLATDERRASAFELLRRTIGLSPAGILAAKRSVVVDVLATGGIGAPERDSGRGGAAHSVSDSRGRAL